ARLPRHTERAALEAGPDVLRRPAAPGELEVVDEARPVHRDRCEPTARDQVDDERPEPDLDRMRAHAEHDGASAPDRPRDPRDGGAEVVRREDVGQAVDECADRETRAHGAPEQSGGDLARPASERNRAHAREVETPRGAALPRRPAHAVAPKSRRSTSSQSTWPTRMWVSWIRAESVLADTRRQRSTRPASGPPSPPVSPIVATPSARHASTARSTLGDRPLVEIATATSPAAPSACTWRANTSS